MTAKSSIPAAFLLVCLCGCASSLRNQQLEQVAKDWSMVMRASQVIPVYPLTEDLQPGDILLVDRPIEEQATLYREKGFLPLDQLLARLDFHDYPEFYPVFYDSGFGITNSLIPPRNWQATDSTGKSMWGLAPHAAFPTYSFAAKSGAGFSAALPIQGIPFAMGLLNTQEASGTVVLSGAYSYGLDITHLERAVRDWADRHRALLISYGPRANTATESGFDMRRRWGGPRESKRYHFLRVVSRVYLVDSVAVNINTTESRGGAADVGKPTAFKTLQEAKNYKALIDTLDSLAKRSVPGAAIRLSSYTDRTVGLSERFDSPLVVGYVGFDMPIYEGGALGAPMSTLEQLTGSFRAVAAHPADIYRLAALRHAYQAVKDSEHPNLLKSLDALASILPSRYPFACYKDGQVCRGDDDEPLKAGDALDSRAGFQDVLDYYERAGSTVESLQKMQVSGLSSMDSQELQENLMKATSEVQRIASTLGRDSAVTRMVEGLLYGY